VGVAPEKISLGALGKQGNDGNRYTVQSDGQELVITPQAPVTSYTGGLPSKQKHKLRLLANGQDCQTEFLSLEPTFVVGQYVMFSAPWEQNSPYSGSPFGLQSATSLWTLGGTYYNDSINSVPGVEWPTCSKSYFVNQDMLRNDFTTVWWVSGGEGSPLSYPVKLNKGLFFSNGQFVSLHEEGKINMRKPIINIQTETTQVNMLGSTLFFAEVGEDGITFTCTAPPNQGLPVPGTTSWLQVSYYPTRIARVNGTTYTLVQPSSAGGPWLDQLEGSPGDVYGTTTIADSPNWRFDPADDSAVRVEASDRFRMYLMYTPDGGMRVPLRAVDWYWQGVGARGQSGWTLLDGSNSINPEDFPIEEYPFWKDKVCIRKECFQPPLP
jgi:hypothetical protein